MWFEKDFQIRLEKVFQVHVEGYVEVDDVTGYVYPTLTEILIVDEEDNPVNEEHPDYGELMVIIHERDYEPDHWSE